MKGLLYTCTIRRIPLLNYRNSGLQRLEGASSKGESFYEKSKGSQNQKVGIALETFVKDKQIPSLH